MWASSLLPILLLVGAFAAHPIAEAPHSHGFVDAANLTSFVMKLTSVHNNGTKKELSDLFMDTFSFKGCDFDYDKKKIVNYVKTQPKWRKASFTLELSLNLPKFTVLLVSIEGIKSTPMHLVYLMDRNKQRLNSGFNIDCSYSV